MDPTVVPPSVDPTVVVPSVLVVEVVEVVEVVDVVDVVEVVADVEDVAVDPPEFELPFGLPVPTEPPPQLIITIAAKMTAIIAIF